MPQLKAITIKDGQTTPVDHVLSPVTTDGWLAHLAERIGYPKEYLTCSVSVRPSSSTSPMYRTKLQIKQPVVIDNAGGCPDVAFTNMVTIEFLTHEMSGDQMRNDILAFARNILSNTDIATVVTKNEPFY